MVGRRKRLAQAPAPPRRKGFHIEPCACSRYHSTSMLRSCVTVAILCAPAFGAADALEQAVTRMYDFDFPASHEVLDRYIVDHSGEPLPYAFRASAYLFAEMDRLGILESEFLVDDEKIAEKKKKLEPDPATRRNFLLAVADAESRANFALKSDPNDRGALFAMCVAQGVSTDYMAFIEKRQISSLSRSEERR